MIDFIKTHPEIILLVLLAGVIFGLYFILKAKLKKNKKDGDNDE